MSHIDGKLTCDWCLRTVRSEEIRGKAENPIHMCVECWERANRQGRPRDQWRANHETKIPEGQPLPPGFRCEDTPAHQWLRDLESMPAWPEDEIGDNVIKPGPAPHQGHHPDWSGAEQDKWTADTKPDRRPESDTRNDVDTPQ